MKPADAGRWEGDVFVFTPARKLVTEDGSTATVKRVQIDSAALGEGVTRDDVIHALLNPIDRGESED